MRSGNRRGLLRRMPPVRKLFRQEETNPGHADCAKRIPGTAGDLAACRSARQLRLDCLSAAVFPDSAMQRKSLPGSRPMFVQSCRNVLSARLPSVCAFDGMIGRQILSG
jgi:hypothetical protein